MADDFADLRSLEADLRGAPGDLAPLVRNALQVTATHVRDDWRKGANRTGLGRYAADITYETKVDATSVGAEIGPTVGDSGSFGLVEDAGGNVKSAPQHAGRDALEANEPDFIHGLEVAAYEALRDAVEK